MKKKIKIVWICTIVSMIWFSMVSCDLFDNSNSIDGVWKEIGGNNRVVTINGSTGTLTSINTTSPLFLDAIDKGYWAIGSIHWRNLTNTGEFTWSGQWIGIYNNSNVATGSAWVNGTWTISSDGQTLSVGNTDGSSTWIKQ